MGMKRWAIAGAVAMAGWTTGAQAAVQEVTIKIPSTCAAGAATLTAIVHEGTKDGLLWRFVNECNDAHTVFVCPKSTDVFRLCTGTGPVVVGTPFAFSAGAATPNKTTEAAVCTIDFTGHTNQKFTYYIVDGADAGAVKCPPQRDDSGPRSELALEVQP